MWALLGKSIESCHGCKFERLYCKQAGVWERSGEFGHRHKHTGEGNHDLVPQA